MNTCIRIAACLIGVLTSFQSHAQFSEVTNFPSPAPGSFNVVGAAQADGRLVLWDGQTVYRQSGVGGASFWPIATGYDGAGGPGFISSGPDGQTMALGSGFGDGLNASVYLFDTSNPQNASQSNTKTVPSHYSGVLLTNSLLLMDIAGGSFTESLLVVVDLAAKSTVPGIAPVLTGVAKGTRAKDTVVEKPGGSSALIGIDSGRTTIYVTEPHDFDAADTEIRSFAVADIVNAFNTATPLDFESDGLLIGTPGVYLGGGVAGVRPNGDFVIPGSGGVQLYNPNTDSIDALLDPAFGGPFSFYSVIYNDVTDEILPVLSVFGGEPVVYASELAVGSLPAASSLGLVLAAALTIAALFVRVRAR